MITQRQYELLRCLKDGASGDSPLLLECKPEIDRLVKGGLVKVKPFWPDAEGWGDWYELASKGWLELNLYVKSKEGAE